MSNIKIITHPLIEHKLSALRDKNTSSKNFREYLEEISLLMAYEVLSNVTLKDVDIETPIANATGKMIDEEIAIYPILRAGLGMSDGFTSLLPTIDVGHIGMYRDEKTLKPIVYLFKHPKIKPKMKNIIIDPMLATGGSAIEAVNMLKEKGINNISFVALLGSQYAIDKFSNAHPDVTLFIAAIDPELNEKGYIVPGLGDAGDRIFGTK
jgi:uracil phosphoribosyltransferase